MSKPDDVPILQNACHVAAALVPAAAGGAVVVGGGGGWGPGHLLLHEEGGQGGPHLQEWVPGKNRNCYLPIVKKTDPVENSKNVLVFQISPRKKTNRIERQEAKDEWCFAKISVVDPNTLNWDPDPEFWSNLDPDPWLYNQFWKKKIKTILEKNNFLWNKYIF